VGNLRVTLGSIYKSHGFIMGLLKLLSNLLLITFQVEKVQARQAAKQTKKGATMAKEVGGGRLCFSTCILCIYCSV
jgi:hypothetical protein